MHATPVDSVHHLPRVPGPDQLMGTRIVGPGHTLFRLMHGRYAVIAGTRRIDGGSDKEPRVIGSSWVPDVNEGRR